MSAAGQQIAFLAEAGATDARYKPALTAPNQQSVAPPTGRGLWVATVASRSSKCASFAAVFSDLLLHSILSSVLANRLGILLTPP
jgi:hypothetical protein